MPLPVADKHPSGSILAIGVEIRVAPLPPDSRIPLMSVVTLAAAIAIDAVAATVTTTAPVLLDSNFDISFGANTLTTTDYAWVVPATTATAAIIAGAESISLSSATPYMLPAGGRVTFGATTITGTVDTLIGATATPVPIQKSPGAVAANAASVNTVPIQRARAAIATATPSTPFIATLALDGIQSSSQPSKNTMISIRSMRSKLFNSQRTTMVDLSMQVSGWIHQRDLAYKRIVKPAGRKGREVWAEYYSPDGTFTKGAAYIADVGKEEKEGDVLKYSFTLGFQDEPQEGEY